MANFLAIVRPRWDSKRKPLADETFVAVSGLKMRAPAVVNVTSIDGRGGKGDAVESQSPTVEFKGISMHSARHLVAQVTSLPSLPAIYFRVRSVIEHPDSSAGDVAREISCDPALTTRLLRLANSSFYGVCGRVESVADALSILGLDQIHHLVLATSVTMAFAGVSPPLMNMQKFWRASLYRALVARWMARRSRALGGERAFVEGLLGDIGHLVLYLQMPDAAESALQESLAGGRALHEVECELIGCDYAEVGAELVSAWNLAPSVEAAIRFHPRPLLCSDWTAEAAVLHVATAFAEAALRPEASANWFEEIDASVRECAGIGADDLLEIRQQADGELETLVQAVLPGFCGWRKATHRTTKVRLRAARGRTASLH